ncbi:ATP-dependent DNA helicase RecQ [Puia sp.]|uniref:RecQ family ATP-dependent DNA helicase n=1 Tax=Puia sp. TaxID=2045100 RepID=UPI002F42FF31
MDNRTPTPSSADLTALLRQYWPHKAFRPQQEEIIRSVLDSKDTIALLPTGGGKSLCYQLPALVRPGLCLVVSPLVALMKDQTDGLRKRNITAFSLHAGLSRKEVIATLKLAAGSNCKMLYVSPERLETALLLEYLPALNVSMIAVDEAHCVSQWGYDFRPPYLRIAALREHLPGVPIIALTASATVEVLGDIADKLQLDTPVIFRQPFTRSNLSYSFFKVDSKISKITEILTRVAGSSIIYCRTRQSTREISEWLVRQGITAAAYHAGLSQEERSQRQEDWLKDRVRVIVSTNAFGMGIDKAAVRTVIHADVPESVESYYQESGRAGRDGQKAYAILLADGSEAGRLEKMPESRFPPMDQIRPVYQDIVNYLQLPVGSGEGQYFDFDLTAFATRFELSTATAVNILKVLEQEGLLSFHQQIFLPARVQFVTGKENLYEFEEQQPELVPLIHSLLRGYEGIFDLPVSVRERQLAWNTHKDVAQVSAELARLQAFGIIDFIPAKETPQIYFFRDRPAAEDLYIDAVAYRQRKDRYATRIRAMVRYLALAEECRSRYLANYFGDKEVADCGICDNCLRRRSGSGPSSGPSRPAGQTGPSRLPVQTGPASRPRR